MSRRFCDVSVCRRSGFDCPGLCGRWFCFISRSLDDKSRYRSRSARARSRISPLATVPHRGAITNIAGSKNGFFLVTKLQLGYAISPEVLLLPAPRSKSFTGNPVAQPELRNERILSSSCRRGLPASTRPRINAIRCLGDGHTHGCALTGTAFQRKSAISNGRLHKQKIRPARLELATSGSGGQRSIQLGYGRTLTARLELFPNRPNCRLLSKPPSFRCENRNSR